MAGKDYYNILGISRNASEKEIKQAYRRLARKHHPDVNPGDKSAEARFKDINQAYEVLSDQGKRGKYDRYGEQWQYAEQFDKAQEQGSFTPGSRTRTVQFDEIDFSSLFGDLFHRGRKSRRTAPRRGQDTEYPIEVSLEEAYHGTSRTIALQSSQPCPNCAGAGLAQDAPCPVCQGTGATSSVKRLEVKIPSGVRDGSRVRVAGQGQPGYAGGPGGDLYLVISVQPHQVYERKEDDLYADIEVPLVTVMLGGEVGVPTLKGKLALKIPSETQNGRVFRLAGQGMPRLDGSGSGDLYARVKVALPTGLSEKEKELFLELGRLRQVG